MIAAWASAAQAAEPQALESSRDMVVSAQHTASDVGAAILAQGGNAIDAAEIGRASCRERVCAIV